MPPKFVVLRCDASLAMGSGHVIRSRTLARTLRTQGADVVFLCRRHTGDLIELLEREFKVLVLSRHFHRPCGLDAVSQPLTGRDLYASWLGCSEVQDAKDSLWALADAKLKEPDWLVVDHYGLGAAWHQRMQEGLRVATRSVPNIIVLDDLANRSHQATVLVDANRLDTQKQDPYIDLVVSKSCTTLLGPAFALIDPIYPQLQSTLSVRTEIARLLVFFGGMDSANYAGVALEALNNTKFSHLEVDVVVGAASPHLAELEDIVLHRSNIKLHVGLPSLAGLMSQADLALGAAGTASWERACLGLPSIVIPVAENQKQGAFALQAAGVAKCLNFEDDCNPVAILQASLLELIYSSDVLKAMSQACFELGDGRGTARVAAALLGPSLPLRMRHANAKDLWLYYWWANDSEVRSQSFNNELISLEAHRKWFAEKLESSSTILLILEDNNGLPLGQIRFDRSAESESHAVIGFSLDSLARGRGFSKDLLKMGLKLLYRTWGNQCIAFGEVRAENSASCRAFLRSEFQEESSPRPGVRLFSKLNSTAL